MKKLTYSIFLAITLAACAPEQAPPPFALNHTLPAKISLDVHDINLADRSGMQPVYSPYNNNHFSPTIAEAIKQWASDRLQATGQSGQAVIIIKDASLASQPLPLDNSMENWFTRQQGLKYIGHADITIEANGQAGIASAEATATRTVSLPEDPTDEEKRGAYFTLLNGLMKDLGQNLENAINTHMGTFIANGMASNSDPMNNGTTAMSVDPSSSNAQTTGPLPSLGRN